MQLSQHIDQVAISVSNKVFFAGAVTTGGSFVAKTQEEVVGLLSTTGPQIVNLCAAIGAFATVLGVIGSLVFQGLRHIRESRESRWRMGDPDRRVNSDAE